MKSNVTDVKGFQFKACIKDHENVLIGLPQDQEKNYLNSRMSFCQPGEHGTWIFYCPIDMGLLEFVLAMQIGEVFDAWKK